MSDPAPKLSVEKPPAPPAPNQEIPASARELRRARTRKIAIRFVALVGIPTLIAIVYYPFLAPVRYDSTATIAIESGEGRVGLEAARDAASAGTQRDARVLAAWLEARHVTEADADGNLVRLRARADDPQHAQRRNRDALDATATWIVEQNQLAATTHLGPAEAEVQRAREVLAAAPAGSEAHHIAELGLASALETLHTSRLEVGRARRYLVVVADPDLPNAPARPRPFWDILTVFVVALVLVAVMSLLVAAVREHANY